MAFISLCVASLMLLILSPQAVGGTEVYMRLDTFEAPLGGYALIVCGVTPKIPGYTVQYLANGSVIHNLTAVNGSIKAFSRNTLWWLRLDNLQPNFNNTRMECGVYNNGSYTQSRRSTMLLLQGLLAAVGSPETTVENSTIFLTWDPPFTLDMVFVYPDITYCVEVVSSMGTTQHSQCNITTAEFTYPLPPRSWCLGYNFIITPVNEVGDGPSSTILFTQAVSAPEIQHVFSNNNTIIMSDLVCTAEVTFTEIVTGQSFTLFETDLAISGRTIVYPAQHLQSGHLYVLTVLASNYYGLHASATTTTATFYSRG